MLLTSFYLALGCRQTNAGQPTLYQPLLEKQAHAAETMC